MKVAVEGREESSSRQGEVVPVILGGVMTTGWMAPRGGPTKN